MPAANPYAAPKAPVADVSSGNWEAENLRRLHISHESSIKSIGLLYLLGGVMVLASGLMFGFIGLQATSKDLPLLSIFALFMAVLGGGTVWVGRGLRALRSWARKAGAGLAILGLFGFPLGTLINGYLLWLLFSEKGRFIFSPEYVEIVRETPHVKNKTSIIGWIFLALVVFVIGAIFVNSYMH